MISKETLHRFLVELDKQYENSEKYFLQNPFNEMQHQVAELNRLCEEHELCVYWGNRTPHDAEAYDISDMFDIRDRLCSARKPEDYHVSVFTKDSSPRVSLPPESELFQKIVKLYVATEGYEQNMPTDVITIDDMSFTVYDILCAINEHAELHRIKKYLIVDRYVAINRTDLQISSSRCYSDELIDEIEEVSAKIIPYWSGVKQYTPPEHHNYATWDDIMKGKKPLLSDDNVIFLCCTVPARDKVLGNVPAIVNIVDCMCESSRFAGIMLIRCLAQGSIQITYKDAPRFQDFVQNNSLFVREIRELM